VAVAAWGQETPEELYRLGMRLLAEHKPDEAVAPLRRVVELRPKSAAAWAGLGRAQAGRGEYALAEEPFHQACLLDPAMTDACLYYGRTLYLQNRFQEALTVLASAAKRFPDSVDTLRMQALCLEALDRADEAEKAFTAAVRLQGSSAADEDPAIDYGVFLYRRGRPEESLRALQGALQRRPNSARANLEAGCVLLSLDRADEAARYLERSAALNPGSQRTHLLLGKAYVRLGKTDLAQRELDQGSRTVK